MGGPIARRLLESGFKLTAYDRDHDKAEMLMRYGGTVAQSIPELAARCNVVLSCLPAMKLSWTFIEDLAACSPMRSAARWSST